MLMLFCYVFENTENAIELYIVEIYFVLILKKNSDESYYFTGQKHEKCWRRNLFLGLMLVLMSALLFAQVNS